MKSVLIRSLLFATVLCMGAIHVSAQQEINFPNPDYLNWEYPFPHVAVTQGGVDTYISFQDSIDYQGTYNQGAINPFLFMQADSNTTFRMEGVAAPFTQAKGLLYEYLWIYDDMDVEVFVWKAVAGDSNLQLLKSQTFHLRKGQVPDKALVYEHVSTIQHYYDSPDSNKIFLYELYFDMPVTVTGLFMVSMKATPYRTMFLRNTCIVAGRTTQEQRSHSFWGYLGTIDYNTNRFGHVCDIEQHLPIRRFHASPVPVVENDNIKTMYQQLYFPIGKVLHDGIENVTAENLLQLTPNPASGTVRVQSSNGIKSITITDMTGRTMMRKKFDGAMNCVNLDISTLPTGAFALSATTPTGTMTRKLIVK